jgi:hypothetical protein
MVIRKSWIRWAAAAAAFAGVAVGMVLWEGTSRGGDAAAQSPAPVVRFAETPRAGTPVPLTADQCAQAGHAVEDMETVTLPKIAANLDDAGLKQAQAVVASSKNWVQQGCPPDAIRGFYPAASGKGGELRVFTQQTFSRGGTLTFTQP